jgi:asparagine synthase (glutamine-hydrolysing)
MRTVKLGALISSKSSPLGSYLVCRQVMPADRRARLQRNTSELMFRPPLPPEIVSDLESTVAGLDVVNAQSLLEISIYLANMLLRDTDQMSMAHALEVREPLLDHVLVETVARIPGSLKLAPGDGSRTKALLVDALPVSLPSAVVRRAKKGFVFPWERWLRRELKDRVTATLTNSAALTAAGLDPTAVSLLWGDYLAAKPGLRYTDILALLHLVDWVQRNRFSLGPQPDVSAAGAGSKRL